MRLHTPEQKRQVSARKKELHPKYSRRIKNYELRKRYGMSLADYETMYEQQQRRCALCGKPNDKLAVDHDHQTGKVRGLICRERCNLFLGYAELENDPFTFIESAVTYLKAFQQ